MDRKLFYECLKREGVPVPRSACVMRDGISPTPNVVETDDSIEIDGIVFHKPFVEKPINAEDHNVYIYFPSSAGGGSQRLFRKVGNLSSRYYSDSNIRTTGSYIYEEFLPTDGTDVKVYTVADDYAHAEARKSPALDGVVERDYEGKEVRYPVILTPREKNIAKKVANAVRQQICGFDLLRANGMSYVCDVNGFSFVKSSRKYYDDCSHILGVLITRKIAPRLCLPAYLPPGTDVDTPLVPTTCGTIMELRCVIAVIRHGDRTPKQKMKMEVRHEKFFALFSKYASGVWIHELKLKRPTQLQEVLEIVRCILYEMETGECDDPQLLENKSKFEQLKYVLEMYGSFSGINRKIQLKYYPHGLPKNTKVDPVDTQSSSASGGSVTEDQPSLLLVVKWGGELTLAGRQQAENLGRAFRCIYPGGDGHYGKDPGLGLLRLHSTYRHDLKIYASDEGRVQMTAAAFAKGFLALEGELPPILVQMVKSANTNGLLDNDHDCRHYQNTVKRKLREVMSKREDFNIEDLTTLVPTGSLSMVEAMRYVNNPREACNRLFEHVRCLHEHLKQLMAASPQKRQAIQLYQGESWDLLLRRWGKLLKDFKPREGDYDLTKISDIYDNIKYDLQHNPGILMASEQQDFFMCAKSLADIVVPQEYGITKEEKLAIGQRICTPLMRKILSDARYTGVDECTRLHAGYSKGVASPERFVRSRLYFTSESHLHSLLTCLRYGGLADVTTDEQWRRAMDYVSSVSEINYLAQIVIMIYEDPSVEPKLEERYHVELHFSPGAYVLCHDLPERGVFRPGKLERLNSQTSVLSSGTSLGKCSTESLTQYSSRMSTHGSVTPITYAPPRQKGRSNQQQHRTVCEVCSASQEQQQKEQIPLPPDDQLVIVSKSPDPSSNISLLTDLGVISSTSQSSLNDLTGANGSVALSDLYVYSAYASGAPGEQPGASPNHEPADDLSKTLGPGETSPVKGLDNGEQHQKQKHPDSTPEATLQCNNQRTGCRPKSMPFDAKVSADMASSVSLTAATPSVAQEVRATLSMPTSSPSSNTTTAATMTTATAMTVDEKKVNIGRFLITRPFADQQQQQESHRQQQHSMTTLLKSTGGTTAPEVNEAVPHSSTSSHTSTSMTLAPTRIILCHAGRQATSCPPDPSHSAAVDKTSITVSTTTTGTGTTATTCDNSDDQPQSATPISSGHSAARRLTPSTPTSPTRQTAGVRSKPPKIAVKRPACGAKVSKSSGREGRLSQQQQQFDGQTRPEELSLAQPQDSPRKTYFHDNAETPRREDAELFTRPVDDEFQLAFHRMHQLMRRHSTGSLMLPHHQLVNQSRALHSAGVSAAGLPTESLNQLFGFLVADSSLPPTPAGQVIPPPAPPLQPSADEAGTGGQKAPQKPRRRVVGRVKVEPPPPSSSVRPEFVGESATELAYRRLELAGLTAGQRSPGSGLRAGVDREERQLQQEQEEGEAEAENELNTANYQALNALTFPSIFNPYHIDFNRLAKSVAMGIPFPMPFCRSLISTAVIRGSRDDTQASSSVPDMKHLMEDSEQPPRTLTPGTSSDFPVPSAPSVPEVYPLETLHNALTLNQLETFFTKITTHKFETPFTSPQHPSTPISFCPALTCSRGASSEGPCQYGSATSLPTTINDDEFFPNSPPNRCDLLPPFLLEAQEQLQQQKLQMLLPQQQYTTTTTTTGGLLHVQSADSMVATTGSTNIPSIKTAAQPSSSTTDGFAEVTSETATDCGCWMKPAAME